MSPSPGDRTSGVFSPSKTSAQSLMGVGDPTGWAHGPWRQPAWLESQPCHSPVESHV